jgi:hypothetical protein
VAERGSLFCVRALKRMLSSPAEDGAPDTQPVLWAMASVTSNTTQEITIFSEQWKVAVGLR